MRPAATLCALILALGTAARAAEPVWQVATLEDAELAAPFQELIGLAFARAGLVPPRFEPQPLRRAEAGLRAGQIDADFGRFDAYFERVPEALRVAVPLRHLETLAFARPPCVERLAAAEFKGLRVAHLRGALAAEALLAEAQPVAASDHAEVLRYVQLGAARYGLLPATPGLAQAVAGAGLCRVAEPVLSQPLYLAVHRRHAARLPALEAALRALEREGQSARIWREAEQRWRQWSPRRAAP